MEKDQNTNSEKLNSEAEDIEAEELNNESEDIIAEELNNDAQPDTLKNSIAPKEITPEEKILELEDKLARAFAEMENQRRRFEKEREDAFNYGGFAFAKETLNLIDNLERSKQILENDEILKNSESLK